MLTRPLIRPAREQDDAHVGQLLVDAFVHAYAAKMPEVTVSEQRKSDLRAVARRRAEGLVFVAELDGRVVGTVSVYPPGAPHSEAWTPNTADLRQLAVVPDLHARGLSAGLLDEAERAAWTWRVDAIALHVRRGAEGVARLYARRGYLRSPDGDLDLRPEVFLEAYVLSRPRAR